MTGSLSSNAGPWASRRVLVTGANGFVGRWLTRALAGNGAYVLAFVRTNDPGGSHLPEVSERAGKIEVGDITDLRLISGVVNDFRIDTIYHLAASNVNTGDNFLPYEFYETNVRGVYTILEAARRAATPARVVIASSREVEDCFLPTPPRKHHPYMTSKASAELITRAYVETFGLSAVLVRSDNIYGGGDLNWRRLIPGTIQAILQGQTPVIQGDGLVRRDYVYIEDAVAAYLAAGLSLEDSVPVVKLLRIATGASVSVLEMVRQIIKIAGRGNLEPIVLNQKTDSRIDVPYQPDFEKNMFGWQSRVTLPEGMKRTWEWYRSYFEANQPNETLSKEGMT